MFKKLDERAKLPVYGTVGSSGADVFALDDVRLSPGVPVLVATGLQVAFMEEGFELQVRPRSGNTLKKGYTVANSPGTIDNDYRGPLGVILVSFKDEVLVRSGDKIAQVVGAPVRKISVGVSDEVDETVRGAGGFGSTGG